MWSPGEAFVATTELIHRLINTAPQTWGEQSNYGKDLTAQRMGRMLVTAFKLHSFRRADHKRGYTLESLGTVWRRMGVPPLAEPSEPVRPSEPSDCHLHTAPLAGCYTCDGETK